MMNVFNFWKKKKMNTGDVFCGVTIRLWKKKQSLIKSLKSLKNFHYYLVKNTSNEAVFK